MQILEKTKEEVSKRAETMSDFVRMEYLELVTGKNTDSEILKYCFLELSRLYEKNIMYTDAIKYLKKYEELSKNQRDLIQAYIKEAELLIKGGLYDRMDSLYKKAVENLREMEKFEMKRKIVEIYKNEITRLEKTNKNMQALKACEKLIAWLNDDEKLEIKKKLYVLYRKLGKVRESLLVGRELGID